MISMSLSLGSAEGSQATLKSAGYGPLVVATDNGILYEKHPTLGSSMECMCQGVERLCVTGANESQVIALRGFILNLPYLNSVVSGLANICFGALQYY